MNRSAVAAAFDRSRSRVDSLRLTPGKPVGLLEEAIDTLWKRRGKRLRPHLVYWFGEIAGVSPSRLDLYAWAAEAVHTATLLHDDVVDEADRRRGGPSINRLYDNSIPVLSGDYLISDVLERIATSGEPRLLASLCRNIKLLCRGEALQQEWRYRIPPSLLTILRIRHLKTSPLFTWCGSVGPTLAESPHHFAIRRYLGRFGLLFQLTDDLLDVVGTSGKGVGNDLREGIVNAFVAPLLDEDMRLRSRVLSAFRERAVPPSLLNEVQGAAGSGGIAEEYRRRLRRLADSAVEALASLPDTPTRRALQELPRLVTDRTE